MSCFKPLHVHKDTNEVVTVPCGYCIGCRMDKAKQWAVRCSLESLHHENNCFITLTFNDENLPENHSIDKRHLQLFFKRFRKKISPIKISYYACGEYGENFGRPHYHAVIFGYDFPDKKFWKINDPTKKNRFSKADVYKVYISGELSVLWPFGYHQIGEVNVRTCGYVARYINKKIVGKRANEHYQGLEPEFSLMSRRPAIGKEFWKNYLEDIYPKDMIQVDGKRYKPPVYFDKLLRRYDRRMYDKIKEKRKEKIIPEDSIRRGQKEKYLKNVTKNLERSYENEGK